MHSFLVSPQVAFRCRIINAWNLTRFGITIKAVLFAMCCPNVVCQFRLVPEDLITAIARILHFSLDTPVVVIQSVVIQSVFSLCHRHCKQIHQPFWWNMWRFCSFLGDQLTQTGLLLLSDSILRNREITRKMVAKILLMLLIYFGRKYTVCGGGDMTF